MWADFQAWLNANSGLVGTLAAVSLATAVVSVVGLPWVLIALPADYFATRRRTATPFGRQHPALRWSVRVLKNALGFVLILVGVALLVLPGQGLLMVLAGLVLAEFPGKRRAERALARRPRVLRAMNWMRAKAKRPPFDPPARPPGRRRAPGAAAERPHESLGSGRTPE